MCDCLIVHTYITHLYVHDCTYCVCEHVLYIHLDVPVRACVRVCMRARVLVCMHTRVH